METFDFVKRRVKKKDTSPRRVNVCFGNNFYGGF